MNLPQFVRDVLTAYAILGGALAQLTDPDILIVARAIQGEGCGLFPNRDEVGRYLAHTIMNRWGKSWWRYIDGKPCTFEERVTKDWHGVANVEIPEQWAVDIAREVVEARRAGGPDGGEGSLFMLSLEDLQAHPYWLERAEAMQPHKFIAENGAELWFFREWVGD